LPENRNGSDSDGNMLIFKPGFFILTVALFIIELLIALFMHDDFVRPYVGDYLVVMLIYCFARTFVNASPWKIAIGVLLFSFILEFLQYFHIVDKLGLSGNTIAKTIIGYGFEWKDLLAYTIGVATILFLDRPEPATTFPK
jgi:hypothetical protein